MPLSDKQMIDRQLINGKPHFGLIFAQSIIMSKQFLGEDPEIGFMEHPVIAAFVGLSRKNPKHTGLERRDEQVVFRPSWHMCNATLGIKFVLWGRAYKVMKLLSRGKKQITKTYLNGQRRTRYR